MALTPDDRVGGIEPELLTETGRASATQELLDQGKEIGDRAAALEKVTLDSLGIENKRLRRRDRWAAAFLVVILTVGLLNFDTNKKNGAILERVDRNQQGIDELVAFVREVKAQQAHNSTSDAVTAVIHVLCASSDPVRVEACAQLTKPGG